ncbi:MAG: hypothetical protein LLG16_03085 [Euryarchaeota archaeon]|nr:hypothetical protein [Euryarchaeota archaeon]
MTESKPITKLTKGSRYKIVIKTEASSTFVSEGEFQGYVQFGQDSGLCVLVDSDGKDKVTRLIPSNNVLYIDVIESKEEEEVKKKETPLVSYG